MSFWEDLGGFVGSVAGSAEGIFDKYIDYENRGSENKSAQSENNFLRQLLGVQTANASTGSTSTVPAVGGTAIPPIVIYGGLGLLAYLVLKK